MLRTETVKKNREIGKLLVVWFICRSSETKLSARTFLCWFCTCSSNAVSLILSDCARVSGYHWTFDHKLVECIWSWLSTGVSPISFPNRSKIRRKNRAVTSCFCILYFTLRFWKIAWTELSTGFLVVYVLIRPICHLCVCVFFIVFLFCFVFCVSTFSGVFKSRSRGCLLVFLGIQSSSSI